MFVLKEENNMEKKNYWIIWNLGPSQQTQKTNQVDILLLETCIEEFFLQFLKLSKLIDNGYFTWEKMDGTQKNINNGIMMTASW